MGTASRDNLRGIAAILVSATAFVLNDTVMKLAASEIPAGEALFLRGIGASGLLLVGGLATRQLHGWRALTEPLFLLRALAAALSAVFIVLSLQQLPLAKVSAVIQVTPLAVMVGASLIFGERIGPAQWLAALAGFTGVMLIIRPGAAVGGSAALLTLGALAFTVLRDLCTRKIPMWTPAVMVSFIGSVFVTVAGGLLGVAETWVWPTPRVWSLIASASVLIVVAYTAGVVALRTGDIGVVVPFRYAQIPMTLALGYAVWGDIPDALASLGITIVFAAGLFVVLRERQRS